MIAKRLRHLGLMAVGLACIGIVPGIGHASVVTFYQSPQQLKTDTNAGDFASTSDPNTVNALNLNQNNTLGQNTPILQIMADQPLSIQSPGGGGQSFLSTPGGNIGEITLTPINPPLVGFTGIELNPFGDKKGDTAEITLTAYFGTVDQSTGTVTPVGSETSKFQNFQLDPNGQNRLGAFITDVTTGNIITQLVVTVVPPQVDILKQFRLNYVLGEQPVVETVPEPSTVALALSGLGTLGFAGLRRYRRRRQEVLA